MNEPKSEPKKFDLGTVRHELAGVIQGLRTGTTYAPDGKPGLNPRLLEMSLEKLVSIMQRIDRELNRPQ